MSARDDIYMYAWCRVCGWTGNHFVYESDPDLAENELLKHTIADHTVNGGVLTRAASGRDSGVGDADQHQQPTPTAERRVPIPENWPSEEML